MNVERLHAIAVEIQADLTATNQVTLLNQINSSLQNQVKQPQQATYQQQVSSNLQKLEQALNNSKYNSFSPVWKQAVAEVGGTKFLGKNLFEKIKNIFERNKITPSVAHTEISKIYNDTKVFADTLSGLISSLSKLKIGSEQLNPGQCEVGFLIPRVSINNDLESFSDELSVINKAFNTFSELATGSRSGFKIQTIASSDFSVFLDMAPEICASLAFSIERIVALYKNLLEIKKHRCDLSEKGLDKKALAGVDLHANSLMKEGIEKLVIELIKKHEINNKKPRVNELKIELRHSLNQIANRIDKGYNFEIRVNPQKADEKDDKKKEDFLSETIRHAKKIEFFKPEGTSILCLPESEEVEKNKEK